VRSVGFSERFFGFYEEPESLLSSTWIKYISPFVSGDSSAESYVIDVPPSFWADRQFAGVKTAYESGALLDFAGHRIESIQGNKGFYISPVIFSAEGRASLNAQGITAFVLRSDSETFPFPKPINADPALVINWNRSTWRNAGYEVFRWDGFPSILIFDYADYDVQDRMLKRLAFFVEKTGFRGRLAPDHEIEELHAWNAHDYRAEDLARFFDAARKSSFPLLAEERQLEKILLDEKIIADERGSIIPGSGAIVSISRQSAEYLRYQFMAHEGYHGLFFIDEDFRDFSRERWEQLPAHAKRFITSYFEFQQYDIKDEYLLINEFMGHVLQQTVANASNYFGRILPSRLEDSWRVVHLPPKEAGVWPSLGEAFTEEAKAFSGYVNRRWGLSAGRVWGLRIK
jgi:hypothetical protein